MPKQILVVEDDLVVQMVVAHHLKNMGWRVKTVETGAAALACDSEPFDLVLTDLRLPDMSGLELARRSQLECPFVFMSGTLGSSQSLPGPVLHKPFDEEALRAVFSELAPRHRRLRTTEC